MMILSIVTAQDGPPLAIILSENLRLIGFTDILAVLLILRGCGISGIGEMGSFDTGATEGAVIIDASRASTKSFLGLSTEVGEGGRSESFNAVSLGEARDGGVLIFNGGDCGVLRATSLGETQFLQSMDFVQTPSVQPQISTF
ncbi:hypothetical protein PIB30_076612 [Stylosanthes scabra]|uniref:Uncharacterized protein n=1 Tax=Stylosanthes scabra TaxID=79078 RepID=A0ABU6TT88_9FABA|nr:hypothetical protein [Stylosanthes scabra]